MDGGRHPPWGADDDEEKEAALPEPDEDVVKANDAERKQKQQEKLQRMALGLDDRVDEGDGLSAEQVAALSMEAREARWGFTVAELEAATKVVNRLFASPFLYVGDPVLAETRLYTMISRDRKTKRENREALKQVSNAEKSRKQRQKRQEDLETIRKTQMKAERDTALANLLTARDSDDDDGGVKMIMDRPAASSPSDSAPPADELVMNRRQKCHTCKNVYHELHHFYYALCRPCGDLNFTKRGQTRDLRGKVVLLTGCRIKIGYAMAVSLLRAGAILIGTSRFVHDALNRFMTEPDYADWQDRVHLFAVDFRDLWMTTQFCAFIASHFPKIFAIVNNAAQTIARTPEYTAALRYYETHPSEMVHQSLTSRSLTVEWMSFFLTHSSVAVGQPMQLESHPLEPDAAMPSEASAAPSAVATTAAPDASQTVALRYAKPRYDRYDTAAEASDLRETNSWTTKLADVSAGEAAEVMAINGLAPMIINSKLKKCLANREGDEDQKEGRFIINVSAMEGQFYRFKQTTHPHTNMAKAALNMMTRTSADDYAQSCIYMNSVDTGWITDESPLSKKQRRADEEKLCPLDEVDAAARCLDPIYTDSKEYGKFFKDYHEIPW